jgi:hypothetical protein
MEKVISPAIDLLANEAVFRLQELPFADASEMCPEGRALRMLGNELIQHNDIVLGHFMKHLLVLAEALLETSREVPDSEQVDKPPVNERVVEEKD